MSWKIVYEILDDPDLYTDSQTHIEEKGEFTAETMKQFCTDSIYMFGDINDPDINWNYVADHINKDEY